MKKLQKKLRILTLVLIAGLLFSSVTLPVDAFIRKQGTVNEAVTLRQNADTTSSQVMQLSSGQQVTVNNELTAVDGSKWYQVFVNDTAIGYVPTSTITITGDAAGSLDTTNVTMQTVTITERVGTVTANSSVRVRGEASTSSTQVASMSPNDTFLVLEDTNGADGYVWHKIEFDDHGTDVIGYVRSDLVSVKEVTREEQRPVESTEPTTPSEVAPEAPYSITSQVNAEGTTVWYLVDSSTGDAKEISALLAPQEAKTGNNGVYKIIVVILLILVILAAAAATFFYMKWQDAEAFIYELREKQVRARKQSNPTRTAPSRQQTITPQTGSKPAANKPVTSTAKPVTNTSSNLPPLGASTAKNVTKSVTQPVQSTVTNKPAEETVLKPEAQTVVKPENKTVSQPETQTVKPESKETVQPDAKAAVKAETKEVLPNTTDIVNATKKELQSKQTAPASSTKSGNWKSKNFLTDDDDLEFDFLDMDEK